MLSIEGSSLVAVIDGFLFNQFDYSGSLVVGNIGKDLLALDPHKYPPPPPPLFESLFGQNRPLKFVGIVFYVTVIKNY